MSIQVIANNFALPKEADTFDHIQYWIHEHPTTVQALKALSFLAGASMVAAAPFTMAAYGAAAAISMGLSGSLLATVALVVHKTLDLFAPPAHDMKNHVFPTGECEGGKLYYHGDVPILTLDADDPFHAGKAHGYLLGDSLNRCLKQVDFAMHTLMMRPRASQVADMIEQVKATIPQEYLLEMQGMVDGYQQWSKEHPFSFARALTVEDIILFHLIPDSIHFSPSRAQHYLERNGIARLANAACTAVIDRDENGNLLFARNMDWPPFGLMGTYSLIVNRKREYGLSTVEVSVPGLVGTLTGMNDYGLSLAMNVCPSRYNTYKVRGMPAAFYNRMCLERCIDVDSARTFIHAKKPPLGPYNLTLNDGSHASSFHFYQGRDEDEIVERPWKETPLTVLNWKYPTPYIRSYNMENSEEREDALKDWFEKAKKEKLSMSEIISRSLSLPWVNNWETTHCVLMDPASKKMEVSFNNGWAAKYPRHKVAMKELFS